MERETLLEQVLHASTNRELREQQVLNIFNVTSLDDIPTEQLVEYCNKHYCTKEV